MITYEELDITKIRAGFIGHGVNCQGVMGSGVARAISTKWPKVKQEYLAKNPKPDASLLGKTQLVEVSPEIFVINCWTQINYGRDGQKYADVEAIKICLTGAIALASIYDSIFYMPKIGCGFGGLNWEEDVLPELWKIDAEVTRQNKLIDPKSITKITVCTY